MKLTHVAYILAFVVLVGGTAAQAQNAEPAATSAKSAEQRAGAPAPLVVYFDTGSSTIRADSLAVLDQASRAYSEGKPLVMIVTGSADRVGKPNHNLSLSQRRATAVLNALLDRGIPADRFQILAKGETELAVPTQKGVAEPENRRVEITWR
jgi:outer membrane protein OmpA-like peptidoglycan-associated protein